MGAGHDHGHVASSANPADVRVGRMCVSLGIVGSFFVLELVVALMINSLALLADAGHMLTDLVGLIMGLSAILLARRGSTSAARTYGWHRAEVLTAIVNAALLTGIAAFVMYEAVERLTGGAPPEVPGLPMMIVALAGLAANVVVIWLLRSHAESSLAVRGAYMEVLADAVGSVGVLVAAIITLTTGWKYADIVVGVLISLWILPRAFSLARAALRILTETSPKHIDVEELRAALSAVDGVTSVHDLHVWTLVPGKDMATAHLTSTADAARVLAAARSVLADRGLPHATIQVEPPEAQEHCEEHANW
ncbi:cation diffusion facilitator family transporter [Mycobacteroides salmoniphilum]|uniref:cation diffusion facilitator family transporter n=1 Tax=Mycobacteroides salmoniphilum TaxID=404941 RepID=UPI0010DA8065|nr:Cobalt-zinc-cadmium resistance protein CzcD [Mycobacteroides salmoniphilum]TDZ84702.1 Cobalt-zinc-cadmium resistance protein CzcD [Mycobacteroides salmoniphilum]